MGRHVLLALLLGFFSVTDIKPSLTSAGSLSPAPSIAEGQNRTQNLLDDELIYVTNVALARDQAPLNSLEQNEITLQPPPDKSRMPESDPTQSVNFVFMENSNDDAKSLPPSSNLSGAIESLDRDYASSLDSTTEPTWYEEDRSKLPSLTRGALRNLHGEVVAESAHSESIRERFQVGKDDLLPAVFARPGTDEEVRLQSFIIGSPSEPYPGVIRDDAYREEAEEKVAQRVSSTTVALVWGEVGRGLVAATEDYRGELGRRPLILGGGRGRARSGPYFEEDSPPPNITAPSGSTVYMDCRVAMLQDKVVTWASRRDDRLQLLTVGRQAYSADPRLALSFRYPNNWRLRILRARRQDQGLYECQVAAHPPLTRQIYLTVISPEVSIWDESGRAVVERYYKAGSFLQLTCSAAQLLQPPELLGWWRGGQHLTEGISCNVTGSDSATCTLVVEQVTRSHAGTYSCGAFPAPGEAAPAPAASPSYEQPQAEHYANATVAVHVLHGNLLGVAVLPNTGKSVGAAGACYISVHKIIIGLSVALFVRSR